MDNNAADTNVLENNVVVRNILDDTTSVCTSLDADANTRVEHLATDDANVSNFIETASPRGNGDSVSSLADVVLEQDVLTGVQSEAVVLIINVAIGDPNVLCISDIKAIGVVASLGAAVVVVNPYIRNVDVLSVDGKTVDWNVLHVQMFDLRVSKRDVEELGLGFSTVSSFAVPPSSA
ncbi:unnamed protein product [Nesidiocoris tenuis]|uniref:Uncharacterized protein n=1 Tax=Nesidiocoris tenuis TaxID=355587 RepID=A0A6H5G4V8_9HEMI|nr:unnamed protein product [Nesidiocoris tenuis]